MITTTGRSPPRAAQTLAVHDTIHLEGDPDAGRTLTLHFGDLVEQLKAMPDPKPQAMDHYGAGVDFLLALRNGSADFGRATPQVGADAPLAEQVLGLTDEAFARAEMVLMATEEGATLTEHEAGPEIYVLMAELGGLSIPAEVSRIERLPPAADTRIGEEFF